MSRKHLSVEITREEFDKFVSAVSNLEDEACLYDSDSGLTVYCDGCPIFGYRKGRMLVLVGQPEDDRSWVDSRINDYLGYESNDFNKDNLEIVLRVLRSLN